MPVCAWCNEMKPVKTFTEVDAGMLRDICMECEQRPLKYCGFCGLPIHPDQFYLIS